MTFPPPGWYADPNGTHERRFFDGTTWTELVVDRGVAALDAATGVTIGNGVTDEADLPVPPAFRTRPTNGTRADAQTAQSPPPPTPLEVLRPFPHPAVRNAPALHAPARHAPALRAPAGPGPGAPALRAPAGPGGRQRSWRTWQVAAATGVVLLLGLVVGRVSGSHSRAPAAEAPITTGTAPRVLGGGAATTTSTVAVAAGGKTLSATGVGNSTSETFTFPGSWQLTWSYTCSKGPGPFHLSVDDSDGNAIGNGISSTAGAGHGVQHYAGGENLVVKIATACAWTVKLAS